MTRLICALLGLGAMAAGCAGSETAEEPPASSVEPASSATSIAATSTSSTTSSSTTTTSTVPPTTVAPSTAAVSALCATLNEAGFDTRRTELADFPTVYADADGSGNALQAVRDACGDAVDRVEAANAIVEQNDYITTDPETGETTGDLPFGVDDFGCDPASFYAMSTSSGEWPIGIVIRSSFDDDADNILRTSELPVVVWSLAPGDSVTTEGVHVELDGPDVTCSVLLLLFDADRSDADGSLGFTTRTELTGDDPAIWLPALLELTEATNGSQDLDLVAEVFDIRSGAFNEKVEEFREAKTPRPLGPVTVCAAGQEQLDPDHVALAWEELRPELIVDGDDGLETTPAGTELNHGVFRRGTDGQWRWLNQKVLIVPANGSGCAGLATGLGAQD